MPCVMMRFSLVRVIGSIPENIKQQIDQESETQKKLIDTLRLRKNRDVNKALSRTYRLSEDLSDEEISKKFFRLIVSRKNEIYVGGKVFFIKCIVNSESDINDFDTNTREDNIGESTDGKESADNSEDKENSVNVYVNQKAQHRCIRNKVREECRDCIDLYQQVILSNISWLSVYRNNVPKRGVLCNVNVCWRLVDSVVYVESLLHQSENVKGMQSKATELTSQSDEQEKHTQSHVLSKDVFIESIPSRSVATTRHSGAIRGAEFNSIRRSMMLGDTLVSTLSLESCEIDISVVRDLIINGAQLNRVDCKRYTPLHLAVWHGREDIVELLLMHGARKYIDEVSDGDCSTPLLLACSLGYSCIVKTLLKWGADILFVDERTGNTALHTAVDGGFLDVVIILLQSGSMPLRRNLQQQTPLEFARLNEFKKAEEVIFSMSLESLFGIARSNVLNILFANGSQDFIEKISRLPLPVRVKSSLAPDYLHSSDPLLDFSAPRGIGGAYVSSCRKLKN